MLLWRLSLAQPVSMIPCKGCFNSDECPPGSDAMLVDVVDAVLKAAELPSSLLRSELLGSKMGNTKYCHTLDRKSRPASGLILEFPLNAM